MKNIILFILFAFLALTSSAQESRNVLFIGNSYTYVNDLPLLIRQMAEATGHSLTYSSNTPGGCTFQQHCNNQSMNLIRQGGWDVVVLQEQSQLPSFPQSQVESECLPYAARLVDSIRAYNPQAEPMFYMTWGRRDGDQQNARYFPVLGSYWGMDSMLYVRYLQMKDSNHASVCPVGRVWRYLRQYRPSINLYSGDGSHPSRAGSVCAAYAFYTMLFHESATRVPFIPSMGVDSTMCNWLKAATDSVVFSHLSFWQIDSAAFPQDTIITPDTTITSDTIITPDTIPTDTVSILSAATHSFSLFPNPASDHVTMQLPESGILEIYDLHGRCLLRRRLQAGCHTIPLTTLASARAYIVFFNRTHRILLHR